MAAHTLPRPRTFDDLVDRFETLEHRIVLTVDGQLEHSQQMGRVIAAITGLERALAELRAEMAGHRGQFESVPEIIDERIQLHDTREQADTWRWIKRNATKIGVGIAITMGGAELVLRLMGK
jgi:hypothetical protein